MEYNDLPLKYKIERDTNELIGMCRGIMADGMVNQTEAEFLAGWLESSRHLEDKFPYNVLYPRIAVMLEDGFLDKDEQAELFILLKEVINPIDDSGVLPENKGVTSAPSEYLFDELPKLFDFSDKKIVLTGTFYFGKRKDVQDVIGSLGGINGGKNVTQDVDILIVGGEGNKNWKHSTHGNKIAAAFDAKKTNEKLIIISEESFLVAIGYA